MIIQAAVIHSKGADFRIEDVTLAEPKHGEVLVKVVASGICHTDVGVQHQEKPVPLPAILGHEGSGIVEKVGEGVTNFQPGDHVVMSYASCGKCKRCLSGAAYACERAYDVCFGGHMEDGTHRHDQNGRQVSVFFGQSSFATHAIVSVRNLVKVDKDLPLEILGPLGCGIQTGAGTVLNKLRPEAGSKLAVFGCGSVGLSAIMAAKLLGCEQIIGVDVHENRLELARKFGATHTVNARHEDTTSRLVEITGGGIDYGIEASGVPKVLRQAADSLVSGGTVALVGGTPIGTEVTLNMNKLLFHKTVTGVVQGNSIPQIFIPKLISLYRQGLFPFDELITMYKFEEINQAVADMNSGKVIKPVIKIAAAC